MTITNNGTGANILSISLPTGYNGPGVGSVICGKDVTSANMLAGEINSSAISFQRYNATYPGGTGARIIATGQYRTA